MISPHTPSGTHLVVVWNPRDFEECLKAIKPKWRPFFREFFEYDPDADFRLGDRLVLDCIVPEESAMADYGARICGLKGVYALEHFDVATLPSCLTELLVPVMEDA